MDRFALMEVTAHARLLVRWACSGAASRMTSRTRVTHPTHPWPTPKHHALVLQVIKLISQVIADFADGEISQVSTCQQSRAEHGTVDCSISMARLLISHIPCAPAS